LIIDGAFDFLESKIDSEGKLVISDSLKNIIFFDLMEFMWVVFLKFRVYNVLNWKCEGIFHFLLSIQKDISQKQKIEYERHYKFAFEKSLKMSKIDKVFIENELTIKMIKAKIFFCQKDLNNYSSCISEIEIMMKSNQFDNFPYRSTQFNKLKENPLSLRIFHF